MYICRTGPAFGRELSFCAEAYGVLSAVCAIQRLMEFYMLDERVYLKIYLDNEGVIQRINKQLEYPYDYFFHTINLDWDIIVQICDILKDNKIKTDLEHVKGHQDDDTPYEELNLPACLNIEVDFMVVDYWTTQGIPREKVI
eukprot:1632910-Ditylum_brightwellii.AAC.1